MGGMGGKKPVEPEGATLQLGVQTQRQSRGRGQGGGKVGAVEAQGGKVGLRS